MKRTRQHSTTADRNQPHAIVPEHLSTAREPETRDEKIDAQMQDSFPASDPPSYSGGNHAIGAPVNRESAPEAAAARKDGGDDDDEGDEDRKKQESAH